MSREKPHAKRRKLPPSDMDLKAQRAQAKRELAARNLGKKRRLAAAAAKKKRDVEDALYQDELAAWRRKEQFRKPGEPKLLRPRPRLRSKASVARQTRREIEAKKAAPYKPDLRKKKQLPRGKR